MEIKQERFCNKWTLAFKLKDSYPQSNSTKMFVGEQ